MLDNIKYKIFKDPKFLITFCTIIFTINVIFVVLTDASSSLFDNILMVILLGYIFLLSVCLIEQIKERKD